MRQAFGIVIAAVLYALCIPFLLVVVGCAELGKRIMQMKI